MQGREKKKPDGRLILTRHPGEAIFINGNVKVTVEQIKGAAVKISIVAPADVSVVRDDAIKLQPPSSADTMD
jgi:carbon storage regulator CsrA